MGQFITGRDFEKMGIMVEQVSFIIRNSSSAIFISDILASTKVELQGFYDSSTQSYAAVYYIRVFDSSSSRYKCRIVAVKSKVAHVKQLTIHV